MATFGEELKRLRESKGLTRDEVCNRISELYSEASSYARVEHGKRDPTRSNAIAILTRGLGLTNTKQINDVLQLAGYEGIPTASADELRGQETPDVLATTPVKAAKSNQPDHRSNTVTISLQRQVGGYILLGAALIAAGGLSVYAGVEIWFTLLSVILYASLYVVSLFLETAYVESKTGVLTRAGQLFAFVSFTSALALFLDGWAVRLGKPFGLALSMGLFFLAAGGQWFIARQSLPDKCLVGTHTAQAAHLKNTFYFLVIVFFFWIPSFHCIAVLRESAKTGHNELPRAVLSDLLISSDGILCLSVRSLFCLLAFLLVFSIAMRANILDRLKPNPHLNSYMNLFYVRAGLYFALSALCIAWFSNALSSLP